MRRANLSTASRWLPGITYAYRPIGVGTPAGPGRGGRLVSRAGCPRGDPTRGARTPGRCWSAPGPIGSSDRGYRAGQASCVEVVADVGPIVGAGDAADLLAEVDPTVAVGTGTLEPGGHCATPTDGPCKGRGVGADAVVAPVARQVGDRAHIILAAGFHQGIMPSSGSE